MARIGWKVSRLKVAGFRTATEVGAGRLWFVAGFVATLLVVSLLLSCGTPASSAVRNGSRIGEPAPDFSLPRLNGETGRLKDWRGQVVLVNFWGTYCPPCKEEMPDLQRLYETHEPAGFTVLAVDVEEPAGVVRKFRDQHGLTFPMLLSDDASVNPTFGIRALPTSWLVDRAGVLRSIWVGPVPIAEAERQIAELLAAAP